MNMTGAALNGVAASLPPFTNSTCVIRVIQH
jgi:hypothetical protein